MMNKSASRRLAKLARPLAGPSLGSGYIQTLTSRPPKTLSKVIKSPRFAWLRVSDLPRDAFQIFVTHPSHRAGEAHFDALPRLKAMRLAHRMVHRFAAAIFPWRCYVSGKCAGVCESSFDAGFEACAKSASPHYLRRILTASNSHHYIPKAHRASRIALLIQNHRR